jgi:hypothetical protein
VRILKVGLLPRQPLSRRSLQPLFSCSISGRVIFARSVTANGPTASEAGTHKLGGLIVLEELLFDEHDSLFLGFDLIECVLHQLRQHLT